MFLKKVKIKNYRQLKNIELDMQDSLTVLAGPNNSGKTTLISVLKGMFCDKKLSFNYSDIPVNLSLAWLEKILPIFQQIMIEFNKEEGIREIINKISVDDRFIDDYIMDSFRHRFKWTIILSVMIFNILQIILWIWMILSIHFILFIHMN